MSRLPLQICCVKYFQKINQINVPWNWNYAKVIYAWIWMHMYPPRSVCEPNMVSLLCMVIEKLTLSQEFDINLTKSVDHENELLSGDICMADMYPPWAMCGLSCIVTEKPTLSQKHDNSKSIDWKWGQVQSKEHSSYVWCQMVLWFKIRIISKYISHRVLC